MRRAVQVRVSGRGQPIGTALSGLGALAAKPTHRPRYTHARGNRRLPAPDRGRGEALETAAVEGDVLG